MPTSTAVRHERAEEVDLRVVRRHDLDLGRRDAGRDETSRSRRARPLPPRATPAGSPWCGTEIQRRPVPSGVVLAAAAASGLQPPLVELLGDEAADVRVEAVRPLEEDTAVRRDRRVAAQQVLEHRRLAPVGMRALQHLAELLRVADEHEVPGGGGHRERIRQRDLAGLVDEEVVEALRRAAVGEQPGRAADEVAVVAVGVVEDVLDDLPRELATRGSRGSPSSRPRNCSPRSAAALSTSASSLWIARWLVEATPTRLPAATSRAISLPAVHVFPEPGGPWITRCLGTGPPDGASVRVAAPDREQQLGELVEVVRLDVAAEGVAAEHRLDRGVAPATVEQRAADPLERRLLRLRRVRRRPGAAPPGAAPRRARGRASARACARRSRGRQPRPRASPRRRVDREPPSFCSCGGYVNAKTVDFFSGRGSPSGTSPPIASASSSSSSAREVEPGRTTPTRTACARGRGSRGAAPRAPAAGRRCRAAPRAGRAALCLLRLDRLRLDRLRARGTGRTARAPPPAARAASRASTRVRDAVLAVVRGDRGEDRVVALDHPALELDDRGAAVAGSRRCARSRSGARSPSARSPAARCGGRPSRPCRGRRTPRGAAGRRARPRACRSGPSSAAAP